MKLKDIIKEERDPRLDELEDDTGEINRLSTLTIPAKKMIFSRAIGPLGGKDKLGNDKPTDDKMKKASEYIKDLQEMNLVGSSKENFSDYLIYVKQRAGIPLNEDIYDPEVADILDTYKGEIENPKYILSVFYIHTAKNSSIILDLEKYSQDNIADVSESKQVDQLLFKSEKDALEAVAYIKLAMPSEVEVIFSNHS